MKVSQFLVVAICSIGLLLSGCEFKDIELERIEGFEIEKLEGQNLTGTINVVLKNPNPYSIKVKSGDFELFSNKTLIGDASLEEALTIKGNATEEYPVRLKADVSSLVAGGLSSLAGLLTGKDPKILIKGELKAGTMLFTKKVPVEVKTTIPLQDLLNN